MYVQKVEKVTGASKNDKKNNNTDIRRYMTSYFFSIAIDDFKEWRNQW